MIRDERAEPSDTLDRIADPVAGGTLNARLQQCGLINDSPQGGRKDELICSTRSACRHLLAERRLRAMKMPGDRRCCTEPMVDGQACHQGSSPRRQGAGTRLQFDMCRGMNLCADPISKQFQCAVDAVAAARSDEARSSGVHRLCHGRLRSHVARRQRQAPHQLPGAPVLLGRTSVDPASKCCPCRVSPPRLLSSTNWQRHVAEQARLH